MAKKGLPFTFRLTKETGRLDEFAAAGLKPRVQVARFHYQYSRLRADVHAANGSIVMAKSKQSITFRLPCDDFPKFQKQAVKKGLSHTEYAEQLVLQGLKAEENDPVLDQIENLVKPFDERLRRLEANTRLGFFTILVECGSAEPAEVEEFLNQQWK